jgi:hypothetical protein
MYGDEGEDILEEGNRGDCPLSVSGEDVVELDAMCWEQGESMKRGGRVG